MTWGRGRGSGFRGGDGVQGPGEGRVQGGRGLVGRRGRGRRVRSEGPSIRGGACVHVMGAE